MKATHRTTAALAALTTALTLPATALGGGRVVDVDLGGVGAFDDLKVENETVIFPATGDTVSRAGAGFSHEGDSVTGTRLIPVDIDSLDAEIHIIDNSLTCDTQDHIIVLDGFVIGDFNIGPRVVQINLRAGLPTLLAGEHRIQILTARTVNAGCGSATFEMNTSPWTFAEAGTGTGCDAAGAGAPGSWAGLGLALLLGMGLRRREEG